MPTSDPMTQLFSLVSCPNYTYEVWQRAPSPSSMCLMPVILLQVGAWLAFSIMAQSLPGESLLSVCTCDLCVHVISVSGSSTRLPPSSQPCCSQWQDSCRWHSGLKASTATISGSSPPTPEPGRPFCPLYSSALAAGRTVCMCILYTEVWFCTLCFIHVHAFDCVNSYYCPADT